MKKKQGKSKRSRRKQQARKLSNDKRHSGALSCNRTEAVTSRAKATNSQEVIIHHGSAALTRGLEHQLSNAGGQTAGKVALVPPPRLGEWLLYFLLPKVNREMTIGDLTEDYYGLQPKLGSRGVTLWYYKQVVIILCSQVPGLIRWLIYAWIREHLRRWI